MSLGLYCLYPAIRDGANVGLNNNNNKNITSFQPAWLIRCSTQAQCQASFATQLYHKMYNEIQTVYSGQMHGRSNTTRSTTTLPVILPWLGMSLLPAKQSCSLLQCTDVGSLALKATRSTATLALQYCCHLWALEFHSICSQQTGIRQVLLRSKDACRGKSAAACQNVTYKVVPSLSWLARHTCRASKEEAAIRTDALLGAGAGSQQEHSIWGSLGEGSGHQLQECSLHIRAVVRH